MTYQDAADMLGATVDYVRRMAVLRLLDRDGPEGVTLESVERFRRTRVVEPIKKNGPPRNRQRSRWAFLGPHTDGPG